MHIPYTSVVDLSPGSLDREATNLFLEKSRKESRGYLIGMMALFIASVTLPIFPETATLTPVAIFLALFCANRAHGKYEAPKEKTLRELASKAFTLDDELKHANERANRMADRLAYYGARGYRVTASEVDAWKAAGSPYLGPDGTVPTYPIHDDDEDLPSHSF